MRTVVLLALAAALSLGGCTRPTLLVCREVTSDGTCRQPTRELVVGRSYRIYATGFGLPRGRAEVRLHETVSGRETRIATAPVELSGEARFLDHPLTLPHVGVYRVELVDGDGDPFRSLTVRAPRPTFHVTAPATPPSTIPPLQRWAPPASPPAP